MGAARMDFHCRVQRVIGGSDTNVRRDGLFPDMLEYVTAVHVRQFQVEQHRVGCLPVYAVQGLLSGHDMGDFVWLLRHVFHVWSCQ